MYELLSAEPVFAERTNPTERLVALLTYITQTEVLSYRLTAEAEGKRATAAEALAAGIAEAPGLTAVTVERRSVTEVVRVQLR